MIPVWRFGSDELTASMATIQPKNKGLAGLAGLANEQEKQRNSGLAVWPRQTAPSRRRCGTRRKLAAHTLRSPNRSGKTGGYRR
jgi:hypothetical protein